MLSAKLCLFAALAIAVAKPQPEAPELDIRQFLQPLDSSIDQTDSDYYLGYKSQDYNHSWSKYYNDTTVTLNPAFVDGLARSPVSPDLAIPFNQAGAQLNKPGYLPLENGYTITNGTMMLAILSDVPSTFTGEQYDFWFSWHVNDTTKYKLWNPSAHQYAAVNAHEIADDAKKTSYRQRYWNLTSFVDEYIGQTAYKISIAFFDPSIQGFSTDHPATGVETIVTAYVRLFAYNEQQPAQEAQNGLGTFDVVLAHQVRKKPNGKGKEIRSRFWFGPGLVSAMRLIADPLQLGHDLSVHCAIEMTHLGTFLPQLFKEYKNDIPTANATAPTRANGSS